MRILSLFLIFFGALPMHAQRLYLVRSGSFSQEFIERVQKEFPLQEGDLVARCKNTTGNNLDLFDGQTDLAFFRFEPSFVQPNLHLPQFTAKLSGPAIVEVPHPGLSLLIPQNSPLSKVQSVHDYNLEKISAILTQEISEAHWRQEQILLDRFKQVNHLSKMIRIDNDALRAAFEKELGLAYHRGKSGHLPSLGFIALNYLAEHYPKYEVVLVGFTFQGWEIHPWEQEKAYANALQQQGRLIQIY